MTRGTDWVTEIKSNLVAKAAEINLKPEGELQSLALSGEVDFFILRIKWEVVESKAFLATPIKELMNGPWLIRIKTGEETLYFCGNDEVWNKQAGKSRYWIHDFIDPLWKNTVKKGMSRMEFWKHSIAALLRLANVQESLEAQFT